MSEDGKPITCWECEGPLRDTLFDSSPKFDYLEEFSGELMHTSIINEERIKREHKQYIRLMEKLLTINSFARPLKNFHANTIIKTLPTFPIPVEDSDSLREEIDILTGTDDSMPPSIESDDYDSEGDIHFLEELLSNDSIFHPENESSNFDHHDDPSFPRPPSEPPDVEIFFEPDSGVLTTNVVKGIFEHYVLMPNILPTLLTFDPLYPVYDTLLLFSSENEDRVFKHEPDDDVWRGHSIKGCPGSPYHPHGQMNAGIESSYVTRLPKTKRFDYPAMFEDSLDRYFVPVHSSFTSFACH
nr:hypothetical protein [Tanacetum cinerariifolium]